MVRLAHYQQESKVLGPGIRDIIWFQGCNKRCKNCISEEFQEIQGGKEVDELLLMDEVISHSIEGITISGGEPFLQLEALYTIVQRAKEAHLGVIIYTGYLYEDLLTKANPMIQKIFENTDLLIDGEYIEAMDDDLAGRGSSNQRFIHLTSRYKHTNYYQQDRVFTIYTKDQQRILEGIPSAEGKILIEALKRGRKYANN